MVQSAESASRLLMLKSLHSFTLVVGCNGQKIFWITSPFADTKRFSKLLFYFHVDVSLYFLLNMRAYLNIFFFSKSIFVNANSRHLKKNTWKHFRMKYISDCNFGIEEHFLAKKIWLSLEDMIFTRFGTTSDNRGNISSRLCLQKDMKMLKSISWKR